jgi:hypothetical protein
VIDGVVRAAVEESLRFLRAGQVHDVEVDGHTFSCVRTVAALPDVEFSLACVTCSKFIGYVLLRRVFLAINKHNEEPLPEIAVPIGQLAKILPNPKDPS